jgi:protein-S-isoprenylcysteine O-methyltransferase Ste14
MATIPDQLREPIDPRRLMISTVSSLLIFVLCLFVPAGRWTWLRGWVFFVVMVAASVVVSLYLRRDNPDVVAARVNRYKGTKGWDRWVVGAVIPMIVSILPLAALDDGRCHWSQVPWWVCVIGYFLFISGFAGVSWAESVNKFFEPTVRIQTDRGREVIDTGPYAIVRHPGYVFGSLFFIGMPLALGSLWALIPAVSACVVLVLRTILEDQTLRKELTGYKEYTERVRYRLVRGIW